MRRTRQRFVWAVAAVASLQATLSLIIALPLLADAGLEGAHTILRSCDHAFRPHYRSPVTLLAVLVVGLVLLVVGRFVVKLGQTLRATRTAVALLLDARLPVVPGRVARLARNCGLQGRIDVVEAAAPVAFCHGFAAPRVCISIGLSALLDDAELSSVLLHEDCHRRRREPLRLLMLAALSHAVPLWSGLTSLIREARIEMEVAADASAVVRGGSTRALARALLKIAAAPTRPPPLPGANLAVSALSPTAARIDRLTGATTALYPPLAWAYVGGLAGALAVPSLALIGLAAARDLHPLLHSCGVA